MRKTLRLIFIFSLIVHGYGKLSEPPHSSQCYSHDGSVVDWWILYKTAGSGRYVFMSSADALQNKTYGEPLREDRKIDDPPTSPFLLTIYKNRPYEEQKSNSLIIAWNDQQPHGVRNTTNTVSVDAGGKTPHELDLEEGDENAQETKLGSGKDMYEWGETTDFAHSKGIIGMDVPSVPENGEGKAYVEFYFIQHSFPRTPNAPWINKTDLPIHRRYVPDDPKFFFGSNITGDQSKAQHAVCISMKQEVMIKKGQIVFERAKLDRATMPLFALLEGLDVIGPGMTMTNYVPWKFPIYHQLFDIRSEYSDQKIDYLKDKIYNLNVARGRVKAAQEEDANSASTHLFPLWPSASRIKVEKGKIKERKLLKTAMSLRAPGQAYLTRCRVWEAEGRKDSGCFISARLTSTSRQYPITFEVDFKNALVKADTDDIIAARLIPQPHYQMAMEAEGEVAAHAKRYIASVVVTQSWFDHATLGSHSRDLVNTKLLRYRASFHNNLLVHLPSATAPKGYELLSSNGKDHSKWFLVYPYGHLGQIQAWLGFLCINRNAKATQLPGRAKGRGGMALFTRNSAAVAFFMSLNPIIEDNSRFSNINIDVFKAHHLADPKPQLARVTELLPNGIEMRINLPDLYKNMVFKLPYYYVSPVVTRMLELNKKNEAIRAGLAKSEKDPEDLEQENAPTTSSKWPVPEIPLVLPLTPTHSPMKMPSSTPTDSLKKSPESPRTPPHLVIKYAPEHLLGTKSIFFPETPEHFKRAIVARKLLFPPLDGKEEGGGGGATKASEPIPGMELNVVATPPEPITPQSKLDPVDLINLQAKAKKIATMLREIRLETPSTNASISNIESIAESVREPEPVESLKLATKSTIVTRSKGASKSKPTTKAKGTTTRAKDTATKAKGTATRAKGTATRAKGTATRAKGTATKAKGTATKSTGTAKKAEDQTDTKRRYPSRRASKAK